MNIHKLPEPYSDAFIHLLIHLYYLCYVFILHRAFTLIQYLLEKVGDDFYICGNKVIVYIY